jgi:hypothetical protein
MQTNHQIRRSSVPPRRRPIVTMLLAAAGLLAAGTPARAVNYRVRWRPPQDPRIATYNVYSRTNGAAYGAPLSAGLPTVAGDGTMAFVATGFTAGVQYRFAVTGMTSDGVESRLSNEIGPCAAAADCNDDNPCTTDTCVSGLCSHAFLPDGTSCDDADVCNGAEQCLAGICRASPPLDCDDGDGCTADVCSLTAGCAHVEIPGCASCTAGIHATLEGKRVGLFKSVYGIKMVMTGLLDPDTRVDPMRTGLTIEIVDATGLSLFRSVVPPSKLEANAAGKGGYHLIRNLSPDAVGGLGQLRLHVRPDSKIVIAALGRAVAMPETVPTRLSVVVAFGDQCGVDSCLITSRKSDCRS